MALYIKSLPLEALLPIQAYGVSADTLEVVDTLDHLPPVETVLFDEHEGLARYLLVDGHHRAYTAFRRNESTIRAYSAIDDSGIVNLTSCAVEGLYTVASVHRMYHQIWQPHVEKAGITSIATLPVHG